MTILILLDAIADLRGLQHHRLRHWSVSVWMAAESEIVRKLTLVDEGQLSGPIVPELATVGINDYRQITTSHHRIIYRRIQDTTFVYVVAAHRQDFQALLLQRLWRR
jgi:plasmid stabilization system protein ParE